jgi:hypothetical protein
VGPGVGAAVFHVWREDDGGGRRRIGGPVGSATAAHLVVDPAPPPGETAYWLQAADGDGGELWFGPAPLAAADGGVPALRLAPVAPNPFNPRTAIAFTLPRDCRVRLTVVDARGRLVATILDESRRAGEHRTTWDGLDARGRDAASGVYFARLETDAGTRLRKMVLAR